jgi:transcriptional regulator with XRE-family HTH domain
MGETFGQLVKRLRNQARLSQEKLAEASDLSISITLKIERDDKNKNAPMAFRTDTLEKLANGLGLSEDSPDRKLLFETHWERAKQHWERKRRIAPPTQPVAQENTEAEIPLNSADDLSEPLVLSQMEDITDCVISMLAKASKETPDKGGTDSIMVTTMGASSVFMHLGQEDRWSQAIRAVMKNSKWNFIGLYRLTGDLKRAFEVIQEIRNLSIYPGRFNGRSFRRIGEIRPTYNILIVPKVGALWGLSTHNPAVIDAAFFYPDTTDFEHHIRLLTEHFNLLLEETTQLARSYGRHSTEWDDTMTRVCQMEADEFLANNCIDATSMPAALYNEIAGETLRRLKTYSPMELHRLKMIHHEKRREAFERNVQSFTYRTIMPWRFFEEALGLSENVRGQCRYPLLYASGSDQYITVDKSLAVENIERLIRDLRRYDNFEIALIEPDHKYAEDLRFTPWMVKGELAVLTAIYTKSDEGKDPVFASEFEIDETSLVRSYRQWFLTIWSELADRNRAKQKENVIGRLTQLLERAGSKPVREG